MSDIFISYASDDLSRARLFAEALQAQGWSVWWDRTIPPGQTFDHVIEKALDGSRCAIVLWSEASITSDWVKTEAAEAAQRRILVPVLIDDVRIPFEFRRIQAARLVGWNGDQSHEEFARLLQAISDIMGAAPGAPPAARPRVATAPPPALRGPRWWRAPVLTVLAAALLAALGATGYLFLRPHQPVVVGVMEIRARGEVPPWMCEFTRDGLNTVLSKMRDLHVFSRQKIDLLQRKRGLTEIEAAEQLGIAKMISGTLAVAEHGVVLEVEVVDIKTGMLEDTERVHGTDAQLVELQNDAATQLVRALNVTVGEEQLKKILASRTDDQLESYKLLTESMGGFVDEGDAAPAPKSKSPPPDTSWSVPWPAVAHADDDPTEAALRDLLERYRVALEAKDVEKIAALYVDMSPQMRESLVRYFQTAEQLNVRFSKFDILIEGDEGVATFTRNDDFKDARSAREMHLEVRVSTMLAKQGHDWKIRGMKKPS